MRKVVLFDMDGTLTPARQPITWKVINKLVDLQKAEFEIGIVTGSDLKYVKEQCGQFFDHIATDISNIHIMPCNGTKYYRINNSIFSPVYEKNMRIELGESDWKRMIES